ncbi:MAG: transcription termination factor NusA [Planctomycetota bacterium]|nr:transcription termination factor NusA [Planctomycetota bacterium]
MNGELLRIVDTLHRDKAIAKEVIFDGIEAGLLSAAKKRFGMTEDVTVNVDRETGKITARHGDKEMDPNELGRIAALTAKQVMMQKIREAERDVIFDEYELKVGTIVTGTVQRHEGPYVIVNLGRAEGIVPRKEQVYGETYQPGERLKFYIQEVKKVGQKVKIVLSRTHSDLIKKLFAFEVPEVADHTIQVMGIAREPGHRTKIAVSSIDSKVDAVGACVGVRGSRIKNIVDELNGEKIDIVRWNDSTEVLIMNSLKPAEISSIEMDFEEKKASVLVPEDQLSLAIGRKGQNVRLASKLTGWELDLVTQSRLEEMLAKEQAEEAAAEEVGTADVVEIPGIGEKMAEALREVGLATLGDVVEKGVEGLSQAKGIGEVKALEIYNQALTILDTRIREQEAATAKKAKEDAVAKVKAEAAAQAAAAASIGMGPAPKAEPEAKAAEEPTTETEAPKPEAKAAAEPDESTDAPDESTDTPDESADAPETESKE